MRITLEALIADLGLTVKQVKQSLEPILGGHDIELPDLSDIIRKGLVIGARKTVRIQTEQGIEFSGEQILCCYGEDERAQGDLNEWIIRGIPDLYLKNDNIASTTSVYAQVINRIPDVINAEPGYITCERLPKLKFRAFPLHYYISDGDSLS